MLQEAFNKAFAWQQKVQCDPQLDAPGVEAQHGAELEQECSGQPVLAADSPQQSQQDPASAASIKQAAGSDNGTAVATTTVLCMTSHQDVQGPDGSGPRRHGQQQQQQPTATSAADTLHTSLAGSCQQLVKPDQQPACHAAGSAVDTTSVQGLASVPGTQQHLQHQVQPPAAGRGQAEEEEG